MSKKLYQEVEIVEVIVNEISEEIKSAVDLIVDPAFEKGATGQSSSIIKVGLDYSIEIIRK